MPKSHTIEHVTYQAKGRRWEFVAEKNGAETYRYSTPLMPGGRETADKVARVINGSVKRSKTGELDNLGRSNMATIFHKAAKATSRVVSPIGTFYAEA
jgi:hypothetical protein